MLRIPTYKAIRVRELILARDSGFVLREAGREFIRSGAVPVRHPLGFLCFPMHRTATFGICLHVWSDQLQMRPSTTSQIHAHSWDLISYVVAGALRNDLISIVPDLVNPTHRVCTVRSGDGGDEVCPTDQLVNWRLVGSERIASGQFYDLSSGFFHTTTALGEAATLVMAENQNLTPELSLADKCIQSHKVTRQLGGPTDIKIAARTLGIDR
ncbi:hypothetical protein FB559_3320 [Actinoallomurus bryophytorum]|uniref:Uncharacterized protein n=1 Tax=Actinoallomurus bryophytorum TaxID=1490222 RepID=A0A543CKT7_9ACTN|nr:hypothetical protein FB559_3320 [Actinoallomurus bryophytorum]